MRFSIAVRQGVPVESVDRHEGFTTEVTLMWFIDHVHLHVVRQGRSVPE